VICGTQVFYKVTAFHPGYTYISGIDNDARGMSIAVFLSGKITRSRAHVRVASGNQPLRRKKSMPGNIFYIIGVIVVVLFILGYLGLR
jgi:hypothetical protein